MSKFSEGPWVATHSPLNGYRVSDKTGWGVAVVLKDTNDEANARLIAAAPQMLDALEAAYDHICPDGDPLDAREFEVCSKIEAAIAAAKGEV